MFKEEQSASQERRTGLPWGPGTMGESRLEQGSFILGIQFEKTFALTCDDFLCPDLCFALVLFIGCLSITLSNLI